MNNTIKVEYILNVKLNYSWYYNFRTSKFKFPSHKIDDNTDKMPSIVSGAAWTTSNARRRLSNLSASLMPSKLMHPDWLR